MISSVDFFTSGTNKQWPNNKTPISNCLWLWQEVLYSASKNWGIRVERVELKDVKLPHTLQRAMAAEAEATREARAKVRFHTFASQQKHPYEQTLTRAAKSSLISFAALCCVWRVTELSDWSLTRRCPLSAGGWGINLLTRVTLDLHRITLALPIQTSTSLANKWARVCLHITRWQPFLQPSAASLVNLCSCSFISHSALLEPWSCLRVTQHEAGHLECETGHPAWNRSSRISVYICTNMFANTYKSE